MASLVRGLDLDGTAAITAVLGPTNTGKTHRAVQRMLAHRSGMIGLPLRLLAREVYDRVVAERGERSVALVTGEEKRIPPTPSYFVCTVEAMPVDRPVDFVAVDEIQLCADATRGHVFTQRLLHARGLRQTMVLGAETVAPIIEELVPTAAITGLSRLSRLSYAGVRKLTSLPKRSAVVAFSAAKVYEIAERLRRKHGGAAVVLGALSPRTRNAQVAMYQSGEVPYLVATDANRHGPEHGRRPRGLRSAPQVRRAGAARVVPPRGRSDRGAGGALHPGWDLRVDHRHRSAPGRGDRGGRGPSLRADPPGVLAQCGRRHVVAGGVAG